MSLLLDKDGALVPAGNVTIPPNHDIPQPGQIVECRYLYAFPESGHLYQPTYLGRRDDLTAAEWTVDQLKYKRTQTNHQPEANRPHVFTDVRAASFPIPNSKLMITLPIAELKPALLGLSKVINKRPTLPVLGMVKIERTSDGWIALTGTDLDTFVTVRLEQPVIGQPFTMLVPLDELQTTAKSCGKNESIQVHALTGDKVAIKTPVGSGWAETRCDSVPVTEFPATPKFDGELVPVPDSVRSSLHEAMECASTDETRYILNGAYIDVSQKSCHCVVGTDGRHLYSSNSFSLPLPSSVVVPLHRFLDWKEFSNDGEWRLKTGANAENKDIHHMQLTSRRWRFITKQPEGNYPNWRQVIPNSKDAKTVLELENLEAVIQVIQRMPDHDEKYHSIGLAVENRTLLLLGKSNAADTEYFSVPIPNVKAEGKNVQVSVNRELLMKAFQFGLNRVEIIDPMSPLRCSHGGRQMVIMPVRVEGTVQTPAPTAQSTGEGAAEPVVSEPDQSTGAGAGTLASTGAIASALEPVTAPASTTATTPTVESLIEDVLGSVEELRDALDENVQSLTSLRARLKLLQREHKSSAKEVESLKKTLKGLQSVRL